MRIISRSLSMTEPRSMRRHLGEWLILLAALLSLAGYIVYSQYQEQIEIETQERSLLADFEAGLTSAQSRTDLPYA